MYTDNNLFNSQWTTGSLQSIAPVVTIVSMFAVWTISLGGLFMVIIPIIRFVINGIYVSAPNFCDRVAEAHTGGSAASSDKLGTVLHLILKAVPNFKALSDFDKGVTDPKTFFIKGIPLFCIYTFIGTFVHYGYFSKFGEKFSNLTLGVVDMVLDNTDPRAILDALPTFYAKPKFSGEKSSSPRNKAETEVAKAIFQSMTSTYSNMDKEGRISLARQIEATVSNLISGDENLNKWADDPTFSFTAEVRITKHEPTKINEVQRNEKEFRYYVHKYVYVSEFQLGIPDDVSTHVIEVMFNVKEGNKKVEGLSADTTVDLHVTYTKNTEGNKIKYVPTSNNIGTLVMFKDGVYDDGTFKYEINSAGIITVIGSSGASPTHFNGTTPISFTSNRAKPVTVKSKNANFSSVNLYITDTTTPADAKAKIGTFEWSTSDTVVNAEVVNGGSGDNTQTTPNATSTPANTQPTNVDPLTGN